MTDPSLIALPAEKLQQGTDQGENTGDRKPRLPSRSEALFLLQIVPNSGNQEKDCCIRQNCFGCHNFINWNSRFLLMSKA